MKPLAFSKSGKFWRGNLHTHSNRSDGLLSPDDLCQQYKDEGYNFLVISDHFVGLYNYPITEPSNFSASDFVTVLGAELHSGSAENGEIWHILAVGLPKDLGLLIRQILFLLIIKRRGQKLPNGVLMLVLL